MAFGDSPYFLALYSPDARDAGYGVLYYLITWPHARNEGLTMDFLMAHGTGELKLSCEYRPTNYVANSSLHANNFSRGNPALRLSNRLWGNLAAPSQGPLSEQLAYIMPSRLARLQLSPHQSCSCFKIYHECGGGWKASGLVRGGCPDGGRAQARPPDPQQTRFDSDAHDSYSVPPGLAGPRKCRKCTSGTSFLQFKEIG